MRYIADIHRWFEDWDFLLTPPPSPSPPSRPKNSCPPTPGTGSPGPSSATRSTCRGIRLPTCRAGSRRTDCRWGCKSSANASTIWACCKPRRRSRQSRPGRGSVRCCDAEDAAAPEGMAASRSHVNREKTCCLAGTVKAASSLLSEERKAGFFEGAGVRWKSISGFFKKMAVMAMTNRAIANRIPGDNTAHRNSIQLQTGYHMLSFLVKGNSVHDGRASALSSARLLRQTPGGIPISFLKARLKAASDSYPTFCDTSEMLTPGRSRRRAASCRRQRPR